MSMKIVNTLVLLMSFNVANAMDGVFDRSAEVDQYVAQLNGTATQEELIPIARAIHISGIGDERLVKAIADRLLRDLPHLEKQYGAWMVRALASTGSQIAKDTLIQIGKATSMPRIKAECEEQLNVVDWERKKNEVMASRRNYNEGDNMRVAQLLNLLQSDDFSLKDNAAYRMNWDKTLDARLMAEIATQLTIFVDNGAATKSNDELVAMSNYAKMLGYSRDPQYVELLKRVVNSSTQPLLRKAAVKALETLKS